LRPPDRRQLLEGNRKVKILSWRKETGGAYEAFISGLAEVAVVKFRNKP